MKCLLFLFFFNFVFFGISQQTECIDFKTAKADIRFNDLTSEDVEGTITYEFEVIKDIDSLYLDAINMSFSKIKLRELGIHTDKLHFKLKSKNNSNRIIVYNKFKKTKIYELVLNYAAQPKKAIYFIDWDIEKGNKQIWTQGQGKYTSNWLPSIDDMNDKIEFDLTITFDKNYEVIANGNLVEKQINDSTITWRYDMQKPMSSYLVALAIGRYSKKVEISKSGIPLEMYYYPRDSLKIEPTYRYTKQIFDFLEEEIGVPYPWQNYKQVPVKDFLYAGMENTSTTIFADSFVIDSIGFVDKNYVNVNAHELAHQWFGDLVTETSGTHHWLQEGFATYYALLAERNIFGDDYYYWKLYDYAQELLEQDKAGGSTSLLNPKSSSTTFYKKGAWVLHMLREQVGDTTFKKAVETYLLKHQFKNVETEDFIVQVEQASGKDLKEFVIQWLESDKFSYDKIIENLELNSIVIKQYLQYDYTEIPDLYKTFLQTQNDSFYKQRIIKSLDYKISKSTFLIDDTKVRQAIALNLREIPQELKEDYESLLNDKSYITIETALYNLWVNFPEKRTKYLNKTKYIQGFNDKNVRILWLTLALMTEDFEIENKKQYFDELTGYTNSKYGFETRINAFRNLNQIQACNVVCKENLKQATKHHNWRFSKYAKTILEVLEK